MVQEKQTTIVIHYDEFGDWAAFYDGKEIIGTPRIVIELDRAQQEHSLIKIHRYPHVPFVSDDMYVEVILHRKDKDGNEIIEKLC